MADPLDPVMVRKMNYAREVVYSWSGSLSRLGDALVVHAIFPRRRRRRQVVVDGVPFCPGDVFTEYYWADRWYNVFHIATPEGEHKGWYCNVTFPAIVDDEGIGFVDMELDLFVHPDGHYTVLDEDEFAEAAVAYTQEDISAARAGLDELIRLAQENELPAPPHGD